MRNGDKSNFSRRSAARRGHRGFTLLEVLLATGLLLGCVIVLAELAAIGREHANALAAHFERGFVNAENRIESGHGEAESNIHATDANG